ncbi:MAG TPA: zinc ribbon domain-containing protein [Steroidobacteraceae bacterium]|nr:zinc ribbon domain-containing protein [Steroidobacteraceae bacterium]
MPFYEYQCASCGHSLEVMQKVSDAPLKKCPHCGKPQLQKLMSAPVFRLKGGGWYETDFKSDQDSKRNLAERPEPEAAKEEKKEGAQAKDAAAPEAAKGVEKGAAEKVADKPAAQKAAAEKTASAASAKKPAEATSGRRSVSVSNKVNLRKSGQRRHAVKRSAAKPARRR